MKIVWIAIVFLIAVSAISGYFLFFGSEVEKVETTTTTLQTTTTLIKIGEKIRATNEVFIYSDKLEPSELTISFGKTIKFVNKDDKDHRIIFSNPPIQKTIIAGDYFEFQFTSRGSIEIIDETTGARMNIIVS